MRRTFDVVVRRGLGGRKRERERAREREREREKLAREERWMRKG
jgi:hypothetical protein